MFMHKTLVELKNRIRERELERDRRDEIIHQLKATQAFEIEKAVHEVRKEMEHSLIESDLKRVEAVAKLNTYIDMDTKEERKHINKMLEKAIESLGKQNIQIMK